MRVSAAIAITALLGLAACNGPGATPSANGGSAAPGATAAPATATGAPSGQGISQADADALCAELNKGGTMARCQFKDGQVVIQPK